MRITGFITITVTDIRYFTKNTKQVIFQDTFAHCRNCCRKHKCEGKSYSNLSGRSSQVNSQSGNTESQCSRQSSLRFLETDLTSRRPLIVSFRRHNHLDPRSPLSASPFMTQSRRMKYNSPENEIPMENIEELQENYNLRYLNGKSLMDLANFGELCSPNGLELNTVTNNGKCFSCSNHLKTSHEIFVTPENFFRNESTSKKSNYKRNIKTPRELFDGSPDTTLSRLDSKTDFKNGYREIETDSQYYSPYFTNSFASDFNDFGLEMINLQPTHICPHKKSKKSADRKRRHHHHKVSSPNKPMPKSCTFTSINQKDSPNKNINLALPSTERRNSFSCLGTEKHKTDTNSKILLVQ